MVSRDRAVAVMMSPRTFKALRRRIRDLERAELVREVAEAEAEYRAGKSKVLRSLRDLR